MIKWIVLGYFFLEVFITIEMGGLIGGFPTFLEIVATAFIGLLVLVNFKAKMAEGIIELMNQKLTAQQLVAGNLLSLVGAIFIILPGFLSDFIGVLMQFEIVKNMVASRISVPQAGSFSTHNHTKKEDEDVIDVEVIESISTSK